MALLREPAKLHAMADKVDIPTTFHCTIDGRQVAGALPPIDVVNPATGKVFAQSPSTSSAQLDACALAAKRALPGWAALGEAKRKQLMADVADRLGSPEVFLALGKVLQLEQGKPLRHAVGEVLGCVAWIQGTNRLEIPKPSVLEETKRMRVEQHLRPVGVVAAICPWNFPVLLAMWKIAPAMVAGCTMVLKPSPHTPLATCLLGKVLNDVLPPGVFNVVAGGNDLGRWMVDHTIFDKVSFTGSVATGKAIQKSAAGTLKRLTLELGGNDAAIVLRGTDAASIAADVFEGAFGNSGQVCSAIKRLYVHEDDHDALVAALVAQASQTRFGDGSDASTTHGPLNNAMQLEIVKALVDDAVKNGAKVETGGRQIGPASGYLYAPTIISGVDARFRIVQEEQFGPALPVIKYKSLADAVAQANDSNVGLGGSVWGHDTAAAAAIAAQLESGSAWVNQHKVMTPATPFGGFKQSGIGRENGLDGLLNYLEPQVLNVAKAKWASAATVSSRL